MAASQVLLATLARTLIMQRKQITHSDVLFFPLRLSAALRSKGKVSMTKDLAMCFLS